MKVSKDPGEESKKFSKQLFKCFSKDEVTNFVLTLLGISDIAHRFILEEIKEIIEIPEQVKYSTLQHASLYKTLSSLMRGELKKEDFEVRHMPVDKNAWQSPEDFENRFVFLVKTFYEELKKEGKL